MGANNFDENSADEFNNADGAVNEEDEKILLAPTTHPRTRGYVFPPIPTYPPARP